MLAEGLEEAPTGLTEEQRTRWGELMAERNRPMRDNDGAFIIIAGTGDDRRRIGTASLQVKAKRGMAHTAEDPEGLANARLISAAPELLEALKGLLEVGGHIDLFQGLRIDVIFKDAFDIAKKMEAKAEGR